MLGLVAVLASLVGALPATANPAGTGVVISQVYGGGGNSGATYTNDFIELYNPTAASIPLTGWSVQYASSGGTTWQRTDLTGSIAAGGRYLIQEAAGAGGTVNLPSPDVTGTIPMSATAGKVVLLNTTTMITTGTSCPSTNVVDLVGYGATANCFEGAGPAPAPSNTTADHRTAGGTDTDNNAADFTTGAPSPRTPSTVSLSINDVSLNEGNAGTTSFDFTVTLSAPAGAGGVSFAVATADNTATSPGDYAANALTGQTIPPGNSTYTFSVPVNGDTAEEPSETFFANVTNVAGATVADGQGQGTIQNDDTDFCVQPYTHTYQIQGDGNAAALTGTVTTQGVVVGDFEGSTGLQGFYLQDAAGDGNATTSDGIFVFTGSANLVSAGQVVRVTGYARERNSQTTLNGLNSNSAAVPAANIVGCGTGSVAPTDVTMPFAALDSPERYEAMLVRLPQSLAISEYFNYDRFGELVLGLPFPGESRLFTPTAIDSPGPAAQARALSNSLRRITLDDGLSTQNPEVLRHPNGSPFSLSNRFRGGDTVQNTIGVLGFDFGLYRIQPTGAAAYTAANPRAAAPEPVGGSLRVAALNTLNFFLTLDYPTGNALDSRCGPAQNVECRGADADQPTEFTRQRDKLLTALAGLNGDVVGLNEIENTTGVDPLGDPNNGLVAGLNGTFGPGAYAHVETGTIGTDAIRVGLIYKPSKVAPVGDFKVLTSAVDPRFVDTKSRPALAQTFEELATGARFTVVVNHLKSKGSDCLDLGDPDTGDGQGNCNITRRNAAQALVDWLATDPTGSGDPDFLIAGDLNSYAQEDPITAIKAGPDDTPGTADDYTNLVAAYLGRYAYSYVFDGQAGYLDHALSSATLTSQVTGVAEWHINADEPDVLDYDTSFKPPAQDAIYEPNAYRSSDHDPILVGLDLGVTYADLCRLTTRLVTKPAIAKALCEKLEAAAAAAARGNLKARDGVLKAFRNQVDAQTGKSVSAADAALLKSLSLSL
ncbi:MAG: ExeM/NucH family extracellular endonuclease [Actinobacteria bacterium]|nr:ExeM/NucH family extracellular endonuclease [Actinomycetota bacterium]